MPQFIPVQKAPLELLCIKESTSGNNPYGFFTFQVIFSQSRHLPKTGMFCNCMSWFFHISWQTTVKPQYFLHRKFHPNGHNYYPHTYADA